MKTESPWKKSTTAMLPYEGDRERAERILNAIGGPNTNWLMAQVLRAGLEALEEAIEGQKKLPFPLALRVEYSRSTSSHNETQTDR